ncbi:MAG: chorismate-binding protein [Mycobacterium sp.]|nr:chorismate-binding protein [Mycobacterium sp.]
MAIRCEDAVLAAELHASEKARAENLMIVDLLRNDIARMSRVGSVKVPELFAVESFATVHQMSSRVQGRLIPGAGLPGLMAALFPCGSVTGAPKIRAMEIIAEVEAEPRGVYCGAIGWAAPDGRSSCWSVAIRTLRAVWPDGEVRLNVGGGVVHDSTEDGEWEEALWKARFAKAADAPGLKLIETMLWDGAGVPRWPLHLARLTRGAVALGWPLPAIAPAGPAGQVARLRLTLDAAGTVDGEGWRGAACRLRVWRRGAGGRRGCRSIRPMARHQIDPPRGL